MKRILLVFALGLLIGMNVHAQSKTTEITAKNSWLKLGANIGVPVGDIADFSNLTVGLELKGQLMETDHIGIGLTTGYNHYFVKNNQDDFGIIPLGGFVRVYPSPSGFFAGLDAGYSFVTGYDNAKGGVYLRPQLGYHNYDWNFFGFYNNVFRPDNDGGNIGSVGLGATYNIRFK